MFCEKCGTQNPDEAVFCAGCGAELPKINVPQGQPNVQASPQGIPNQPVPEGQPVYQQPVYQQPVKVPRKPMPMGAKIAIIAVAALIVLVTAGSLILSSLTSPKHQVEQFAKAYVAHDSGKLFNLLNFEKSDFITPEAFKKSLEEYYGSDYTDMTEYTIEDDDEDDDDKDKKKVSYTVEFTDKSHSSEYSKTITLTKSSKKKFLFFDNWKINTSSFVAKNGTINVTDWNEKASVDGVDIAKYKSEDSAMYEIPYIFPGTHKLAVELDMYEPYETEFEVEPGEYVAEHIASVSSSDMQPKQEIVDALTTTAKDTVTNFYTSAIAQKAFTEAFPEGTVDSECDLEDAYTNWISNNVTNENKMVTSIEFTDVQTESGDWFEDQHGTVEVEVDVEMSYNVKATVKDFWSDKKEDREASNSGSCSLRFKYVDGKWVVMSQDYLSIAINY